MNLQELKDAAELLSYLVVVLGVPTGLVQYGRAKTREREEREWRAYDRVSASYLDFQRLCLEYPYLDLFDVPDAVPVELTALQRKQETVACSMLFAIFERAYLVYAEHPTHITAGQWQGWDQHIRSYFARDSIRRVWQLWGGSYDPRFEAYVRRVYEETTVMREPYLEAGR